MIATLDFETYSEAGFVWDVARNKWGALPGASQGKKGLSIVGAARYSEHPSTEALSLTYNLGHGPILWTPSAPPPIDLFKYLRGGGLIEAWNVGFEYWIWTNVCMRRYGWPALPVAQLRCAMAKARASSWPGKLEVAGRVMGLTDIKDKEGTRLLNKFSIPRNPTQKDKRTRIRPEDDWVDAQSLYHYNAQDLVAETAVSSRCVDIAGIELEWWQVDQAINRRGVQIDIDGVNACIAIIGQAQQRYNTELYVLTNGVVARASENAQLITWLHTQDVHTESLDEEHVDALLARKTLPAIARRAIEIRNAVASSSIKKVFAMANQVCANGRLHDLYTYHGAHTGRPTGNGPQPTNLPSGGPQVLRCSCERHYGLHLSRCPWCGTPFTAAKIVEWGPDAAEDALRIIACRSLGLLEAFFGQAMATMKGCLRGLFIAKPGHVLIGTDYSAIEAVVLAMLAGEQWRIDVFRTHGKIYEASVSRVTGKPLEYYLKHKLDTGEHHPDRKKGKVRELAAGFRGWVGAWIQFGADEFMTEDEIKEDAMAWRAESPAIVEFWGGQWRKVRPGVFVPELYGIEGMSISAVMTPGTPYTFRGITFQMRGDVLYCKLRSGRELKYHRPRLTPTDYYGKQIQSLSYERWNTNPKAGLVGWIRVETHGGKTTENIVQAEARDIHTHACINLERAGYKIVLHTYDEIEAEVPEQDADLERFEAIVNIMPPHASDWPIKASGGWIAQRFRKG